MMTAPVHQMLPLGLLRRDQSARVAEVLGNSPQAHRLRELGLHPGAQIRMVQPGASCIIGIGERRLCLRACECAQVLVNAGDGA